MNMPKMSELTQLNSETLKFEKEKTMKKYNYNQHITLIVFVALALFLTACYTNTLAAEDNTGDPQPAALTVSQPRGFYLRGGQYSGDDIYDPAASLLKTIASHHAKPSYSGDDAYDPAAGGLTR